MAVARGIRPGGSRPTLREGEEVSRGRRKNVNRSSVKE
jgi:hypothetical protein